MILQNIQQAAKENKNLDGVTEQKQFENMLVFNVPNHEMCFTFFRTTPQ